MTYVYLAPHLDDAVLSCGGAIHSRTTAGEPVSVITIFAGEFPQAGELSSFALEQHGYWGQPPRPVVLRRAEDVAALTRLRASSQHLDYLDAVYRADDDGRWLYTDVEALFGEVHPDDPLALNGARSLADRLAGLLVLDDDLTVYAPMGTGHHVDHQIVHMAARQILSQGCRMAFYEDYPYAEQPGAVEAALAAAGAEGWQEEVVPLTAVDLAAKVSALAYYRTQMSILFGGAELMPSRVWAFAAARSQGMGLAEGVWRPVTPRAPGLSGAGGRMVADT